jgi:NADP-dependent 3-hydroxy acid dehydrogenase YdfG
MRDLTGKVAVVTGAGSGFGRALVIQLKAAGAVPVLLDKSAAGMAETISLAGLPSDTMAQEIDVRDGAAMSAFAQTVQDRYGHIDIMVNNAGMISRAESFLEMDEDHSKLIFDVNYWGVNHGCRAFAPFLARNHEAALVNVASSMGACGCPLHSSYCASKAAVISYSEVLRQELRDTSIAVTIVLPGAAKTNLGRNIPIDDAEKKQKAVANFERFAITKPEDVAKKIIRAIQGKKPRVSTGVDGVGLVWLVKYFPRVAHWAMNTAYRRSASAEQFAVLNSMAKPSA